MKDVIDSRLLHRQLEKYIMRKDFAVLLFASVLALPAHAELTRADQSIYNFHPNKANTSQNLTKADLAWHASKTFGFDCSEVIKQKPVFGSHHSIVTCSSGARLHVHPLADSRPQMKLVVNTF
jgi:hypothetical protein